MRVLVVSQYFWPETFRINDLVLSMKRAGIDVTVLTGKPNYPEGKVYNGYHARGTIRETLNGVTILRVPIVSRGRGSLHLIANYMSFVITAGLLAPFLLFRKRFDVIFVYAPSPLLQALAALPLKWIKGAPMVVWVQDIWPESLSATGHIRNRFVLKAVELLVRFVYHYSDQILIQSEAFRRLVSRLADPKKIHYFPNPADNIGTTTENDPCTKVADSIRPDLFSVIFAGNLGAAQSLETIIEAALIVQERMDIRFYLIGDGSYAAWMREQITAHNLKNVTMLGRHPVEAMPSVFAKASALLVTLRDEFIFSLTVPSKIQAYLAAGRPIIAALNGEGSRIVLEAEAGIACPASDGAALADAVLRLADMPEHIRQAMGTSGRRYCETHFELLRLTDELILRFKNLVKDSS